VLMFLLTCVGPNNEKPTCTFAIHFRARIQVFQVGDNELSCARTANAPAPAVTTVFEFSQSTR
jgi:hypothetical protein